MLVRGHAHLAQLRLRHVLHVAHAQPSAVDQRRRPVAQSRRRERRACRILLDVLTVSTGRHAGATILCKHGSLRTALQARALEKLQPAHLLQRVVAVVARHLLQVSQAVKARLRQRFRTVPQLHRRQPAPQL